MLFYPLSLSMTNLDQPMHPIDDYAQWALTLWFPSDRAPSFDAEVFDHAVMGMGLAGEALETLENAIADGPLDMPNMLKELGDTLYYWCVACSRAGLVPSQAWPSGFIFDAVPSAPFARAGIERAAIHLAIASGKCAEAFKKMVRDGADSTRLAAALPEMATRWVQMTHACGFSARAVAQGNRTKLAGRMARGTLRGDGNDR
jgi:hypothetical protein